MSAELVIYFVMLGIIAVSMILHEIAAAAWRRGTPAPEGKRDEIVRKYSGRKLRIIAKRNSQVDGRLIGYRAVDDFGESYELPLQLKEYGYRVVPR